MARQSADAFLLVSLLPPVLAVLAAKDQCRVRNSAQRFSKSESWAPPLAWRSLAVASATERADVPYSVADWLFLVEGRARASSAL